MSTEVATAQKRQITTVKEPKTLRDHLESPSFAAQMAKVLPKHLTPERMARVAATAMTRIPKLAQCDQASFFSAMLTLSQIGLEPDGRLAHLIPYGTACQLIIDWKGLAQLAYRSGMVSTLHADVIYTGDNFEYSCGEIRNHIPHFLRTDTMKPEKRGEMIGAYAIALMKDGAKMGVVLSIDEVDAVRKRSKASSSGPWVTDYPEMAKKTAFRRLSKWLPLESEKFRAALDADDNGADAITNVTPAPVAVEQFISSAPQANGRQTTPAPAKVFGDLVAQFQEVLDACDASLSHVLEDLVAQGELEAEGKPTAASITAISNLPTNILEAYLADGAAKLREAINWAKSHQQ